MIFKFYFAALLYLGWSLASPGRSMAQPEGQYVGATFGVESFGGIGECSGSDLSWARDDADAVRDSLEAMGYEQVTYNTDTNVDDYRWADSNTIPWGEDNNDPYGTDFADVIFHSAHGVSNCGSSPYYSSIVMGSEVVLSGRTQICSIRTSTHIRFGSANGDANALILADCQSMQYCVWASHDYDVIYAGGFNILNGYHGDSYDDSTNTYYYGVYVQGAELNGIGDDWVDLLTDFGYSPDQCATTMVAGTTFEALDNQFNNGGFMDFKSTAPYNGGSKYYYINGCDPADGPEL